MSEKPDLRNLFTGQPFHELVDLDATKMNDAELEGLYKTLQARVSDPAVRRVEKTRAAKKTEGKLPKIMGADEL